MTRLRALSWQRRVGVGAALGVAVGVAVVLIAHGILGADENWWPVVVAAGFGGSVIGALLGAETSGEPPDEGYDGLPDRRAESR
jgi:hypothetical protein